ncbi:hypothetical protein ACTFIU_008365 [Dictyostelium citrinum]
MVQKLHLLKPFNSTSVTDATVLAAILLKHPFLTLNSTPLHREHQLKNNKFIIFNLCWCFKRLVCTTKYQCRRCRLSFAYPAILKIVLVFKRVQPPVVNHQELEEPINSLANTD